MSTLSSLERSIAKDMVDAAADTTDDITKIHTPAVPASALGANSTLPMVHAILTVEWKYSRRGGCMSRTAAGVCASCFCITGVRSEGGVCVRVHVCVCMYVCV